MDDITPHLPGLRRYARALTGNAWAADDLVQDTLERACRKWLLWRPGTHLRAWLFTLMHRVYLNQLRAVPAQPPLDLESVQDHLQAPPARTDDALDLDRCLQRLPAEQRAVLLLVTLEDMDYAAAAKVLGVPVGTVMSRLSRARQRLRELMEPQVRTPGAVPDAAAPRPPSQPAAPRLRRLK